jgi:hypothetical protein
MSTSQTPIILGIRTVAIASAKERKVEGGAVWWYQSLDFVSSDFPLGAVRATARDLHIPRVRFAGRNPAGCR